MITGINHVGICVNSIDTVLDVWKQEMGAEEIGRAAYPALGQISAMIQIGDSYVELMEPMGEEGVVASFLRKHGEGLHHVSLHSDDLSGDKRRFESTGTRILGKGEDPVIFTHPKTSFGVVFEITEGRNEKIDL